MATGRTPYPPRGYRSAGPDGPVRRWAEGIRLAYLEARSCLAALQTLDRNQVIADAADLGPYHFLLNERLIVTAETYLGLACQHRATAAGLGIHPNTLYQRLDRIAEILGNDWRDGGRSLDIQLALRINRMIGWTDRGKGEPPSAP